MNTGIFVKALKEREPYMKAEEREDLYKDINAYYLLDEKTADLYIKAQNLLEQIEKNKKERFDLSEKIKNKIIAFDEKFKQQNTNVKNKKERIEQFNEMAQKLFNEFMELYGINQ